MLWAGATNARAAEQVVRNDTFEPPADAIVVGDFAVGEMAGVTLTSPCDGAIVAIQILWLSQTGGATDTLEQNIWIFNTATASGSNPQPGPTLLQLQAPVLSPGFLNEFRFMDEAGTIPINVPVTNGQSFLVALEFANATDIGNGTASVVRDDDGCQANRNWLYGNIGAGTQWYDFCLIITGDLVIRVVVDCQEPTGACCDFDASCTNDVQEGDCQGSGQTFFVGQTCGEITCPPPTGACCRAGGCLQNVEQATCEGPLAGVYAGDGTNCDDDVCVAGACCAADGQCTEVFEVQCVGGTFQGPGTSCTPNPCPQPQGACCFDDFCLADQVEADCTGAGGLWAGPFTTCFTDLCPLCDDGDADQDGDVDLDDFAQFQLCFGGPAAGLCNCLDMDNDNDVDLDDYALFQPALDVSGP